MRNQNRPSPAVERLEPRITLSVDPALRHRTRHEVSQSRSAALDQAPAPAASPPAASDAETAGDGNAPVHDGGMIHAASFGGYTLESHIDGHPAGVQGSPMTAMTAGPVAMMDN